MIYEELEKNKVYVFDKIYKNADDISMLGKVIYKSTNFIHIKPIGFIEGYGDVKDIREFNKLAFESFYTIQREVNYCGDTPGDYPEEFI